MSKRIEDNDPRILAVLRAHGADLDRLAAQQGYSVSGLPTEAYLRAEYGLSKQVARTVSRVIKAGGAKQAKDTVDPALVAVEDRRNARYVYEEAEDSYTICVGSQDGGPIEVTLAGDVVRGIRSDYSDVASPALSVTEVARKYGIRRSLVPLLLRALEVTHADDPFTAEEVVSRPVDDLLSDMETSRRSELGQRWERRKHKMDQEDALKWRRWQISAEELIETAFRPLLEGSAKNLLAPQTTPTPPSSRPYLAFVGLADYHYGDFSGEETRSPYSIDLAERRLTRCVDILLEEFALRGAPECIRFGLYGDIFTADTDGGTTTKGTAQHLDGDQRTVKMRGIPFLWSVVQRLSQYAPLTLEIEPGNHDRDLLATMAICWKLMVKEVGEDRVNVVYSPKSRTYWRYGVTGVGAEHGDMAKPQSMPALFAAEAPDIWSASTHRVIFHGHWHHETTKRYPGVTVRQLRSLSGHSKWAEDFGFVGSDIGLDCYLIDKERGPTHHIFADPGF